MKTPTSALISIVLCCAGCVSASAAPERVSVLTPMPQDVQSIVIQVLPIEAGSLKKVEGLANAPLLFAQDVQAALKARRPSWQVELADPPAAGPDADLVIDAKLVAIDGGSASSRFWIGFGAGKARSQATVSIRDREGRELANASISQVTACPTGACTESNEAMVRASLKDLGAEAAAFIANPVEFRQRVKSESK